MGVFADRCAYKCGFTRPQQDDYAVASFLRAFAATAAGLFEKEIVPIEVQHGKERLMVGKDEFLKRFNEEKLRKLRPVFGETGTKRGSSEGLTM